MNLLSYLADELLRGCQFADNQVQALQNQEIEDFSVHGSRLPELEAEVVQIQLLLICLRYLISVVQQDLFWATCRLFSIFLLFWILECFCLWILLLCLPLYFWDIDGE